MINLGEDGIKLMLGSSEVSKAYIGTEQVYPNEQPYEGFARLTYLNGDVYEIEGSGELTNNMVRRSITSSSDPHYYGKITKAEIGGLCTRIGESAFLFCSGLTSVEIPNSVTSIGYNAFSDCSGLRKVVVKDIAAWCNIEFLYDTSYVYRDRSNPLYYAHHLYSDENTEITDLVIPNGVTSIGNLAFYECKGLTSVEIPNSVTSIGYNAFYDCSGLTSIIIRATNVPHINSTSFENTNGCPIYVPAESLTRYKSSWLMLSSRIFPIP